MMNTTQGPILSRLGALAPVRAGIANLWRTWRDPRTPRLAQAVLLLGALYVVMPFDFLPDVAPAIGWLDDLTVMPLALAVFQWLAARRVAPVTAGVMASRCGPSGT